MKLFYSASLNGFFTDIELYTGLPEDLVEVESEVRDCFVAGKEGFTLGPDKDGLPSWIEIPPPSKAQMIVTADQYKAELRSEADAEISWLQDSLDSGTSTTKEETNLKLWRDYRVSLMRIDTSKAPDLKWPDKP